MYTVYAIDKKRLLSKLDESMCELHITSIYIICMCYRKNDYVHVLFVYLAGRYCYREGYVEESREKLPSISLGSYRISPQQNAVFK